MLFEWEEADKAKKMESTSCYSSRSCSEDIAIRKIWE